MFLIYPPFICFFRGFAERAIPKQDENDHKQRQQEEVRRQYLATAATAAAAATLRARERSDNAALVAVGRLRAPQSVFNPLHRTPSRPEMRRSITHGRFSPVGRKLWRQSEGLFPRTGQLCLSPRRRVLAGECNATGVGIVPSLGGEPVDVAGWDEIRPSLATRQQQLSPRDLTDTADASPVRAEGVDRLQGSAESLADVPPASGRSWEELEEEEEHTGEAYARRDETNTVGEGVYGLDRLNCGGDFAPDGIGEGLQAEEDTATAQAQDDERGMPTDNRSGRAEGVSRNADAGAPDCFIGTARPDNGDAQAGWAITASNGPEDSAATRCLSYTVKLPWDGHK